MLKVDLDLVKKYNVAGPRYTSYRLHQVHRHAHLAGVAERILENIAPRSDLSLISIFPFAERSAGSAAAQR